MDHLLKKLYTIHAPIENTWRALTDPSEIDNWGAGPAKMTEEENVSFQLWGGDIYGKNKTVKKPHTLIQEWYGGKWEHPSIVTFELKEQGDSTLLTLRQKNVPKEEYNDIENGWDEYYLGPLKEYVESKTT